MTEPRMRLRQHGQVFATNDLEGLLFAFGDSPAPALPQTVRVLDEIIKDYIIETSHAAALCASYSRRAKIKVDDFKFMLRRDPKKLGRVLELLYMEKKLKQQRKAFDVDQEEVKKAKKLARAEERSKKRQREGRDEDDEEEGDDDNTTVVEGSVAGGPEKKKSKKKKKVRTE